MCDRHHVHRSRCRSSFTVSQPAVFASDVQVYLESVAANPTGWMWAQGLIIAVGIVTLLGLVPLALRFQGSASLWAWIGVTTYALSTVFLALNRIPRHGGRGFGIRPARRAGVKARDWKPFGYSEDSCVVLLKWVHPPTWQLRSRSEILSPSRPKRTIRAWKAGWRPMEDESSSRLTGIFRDHHAEVLAYCVRRMGRNRTDGEDAAAEVFAVAARRVEEIDWSTVRPWLYGVARGVIANRNRSLSRRRRLDTRMREMAPAPTGGVDEIVIKSTETLETLAALRRLRPGDQEMLMLSAWEGLSLSEIALSLEISVDAAKKRLERAKHRLAEALQREPKAVATARVVMDDWGDA